VEVPGRQGCKFGIAFHQHDSARGLAGRQDEPDRARSSAQIRHDIVPSDLGQSGEKDGISAGAMPAARLDERDRAPEKSVFRDLEFRLTHP
jgi:hypothetical protein